MLHSKSLEVDVSLGETRALATLHASASSRVAAEGGRLQELIGVHVGHDRDVFGEGKLVERFTNQAAQTHDRFAAQQDVEARMALQFLERSRRRGAAGEFLGHECADDRELRAEISTQNLPQSLSGCLLRASESCHPPRSQAPQNLVTETGDPKPLDFGIAKLLTRKGENQEAAELVEKAIAISKDLVKQSAVGDCEKDLLAELETEKAKYTE